MKHLIVLLVFAATPALHANVIFRNVDIGQLADSEKNAVESYIVSYIEKHEDKAASVSVDYSCTNTPMLKIFCAVSFVSELGKLGASAIKYDRNTNQVSLLEGVID
jgi:hypothetical protein